MAFIGTYSAIAAGLDVSDVVFGLVALGALYCAPGFARWAVRFLGDFFDTDVARVRYLAKWTETYAAERQAGADRGDAQSVKHFDHLANYNSREAFDVASRSR